MNDARHTCRHWCFFPASFRRNAIMMCIRLAHLDRARNLARKRTYCHMSFPWPHARTTSIFSLGVWWSDFFVVNLHGQDPVSISEKTSYRKISWSLEATRFVFRIVRSLWNLTGTSAAVLPMCLSNCKAIRQFKVPISWLRDYEIPFHHTPLWLFY